MIGSMGTRPSFLDPNGRSGRSWFLVATLGLAGLEVAEGLADAAGFPNGFGVASAVYMLWFVFTAIPRRVHDVDHSAVAAWLLYLLLGLPFLLIYLASGNAAVPTWIDGALIWSLIVIALLIWPGKPEPNRWGPAPGGAPSPQTA